MKIPVIKAFIDKNTGKPYNAGCAYESGDLVRIAELQAAGYLVNVPLNILPENHAKAVVRKPKKAGV